MLSKSVMALDRGDVLIRSWCFAVVSTLLSSKATDRTTKPSRNASFPPLARSSLIHCLACKKKHWYYVVSNTDTPGILPLPSSNHLTHPTFGHLWSATIRLTCKDNSSRHYIIDVRLLVYYSVGKVCIDNNVWLYSFWQRSIRLDLWTLRRTMMSTSL